MVVQGNFQCGARNQIFGNEGDVVHPVVCVMVLWSIADLTYCLFQKTNTENEKKRMEKKDKNSCYKCF